VIDEQIAARLRNQHGELLQELDPAEDERTGAVGPRVRKRETDPAVGQDVDALLRERWAQQVVAESLEAGAVVGPNGAAGVQIEVGVAGLGGRDGARGGGAGHATDTADAGTGCCARGSGP